MAKVSTEATDYNIENEKRVPDRILDTLLRLAGGELPTLRDNTGNDVAHGGDTNTCRTADRALTHRGTTADNLNV